MKYLQKYDKFYEGWFSDKLKRVPQSLKSIYDTFYNGISKIIQNIDEIKEEIKGDTKEGYKKIKDEVINSFEESFNKSIDKFKDIKNNEDVKRVYSDFILGLSQVRSSLRDLNKDEEEQIKESLESEISDMVNVFTQNMMQDEFKFDELIDKEETLEDKIKLAQNMLKKTFKKSKDEIKGLEISDELSKELEGELKDDELK